MRIGVIGLGKAGGSLIATFRQHHVDVTGIGRQLPADLSAYDVIFLAVPDAVIAPLANQLAQRPSSALPKRVAHLCGAQGLALLQPLAAHCAIAQVHPLAVQDGHSPMKPGTFVGICADTPETLAFFTQLMADMALTVGCLTDGSQTLYHAGAVILSNHCFALAQDAQRLFVDAGIDAETARIALARLLESAAHAWREQPLPQVLTGPVKRGDGEIVAKHLQALDAVPAYAGIAARYRMMMQVLKDMCTPHRHS